MVRQIRNMESECCIAFVKNELHKLGIPYEIVELGKVEFRDNITREELQLIDNALRNTGLELMEDKKSLLYEKIKTAIYQWIYLSDDFNKPNFSEYISKFINRDYVFISNLFSGVQGITIEKYIIAQKIDRVKELLAYTDLSLSDIAFKLQYSSVAHLSNQFKKITGLTPSVFKQLGSTSRRKPQNV